VVEAHGGVIELLPSSSGARFRIILPAATDGYAGAQAEEQTE
jgi:signal transduction histidine kinase